MRRAAHVIPMYPDIPVEALRFKAVQQQRNAAQNLITLLHTRAQLTKSTAEVAECRAVLRDIQLLAMAVGESVEQLKTRMENTH